MKVRFLPFLLATVGLIAPIPGCAANDSAATAAVKPSNLQRFEFEQPKMGAGFRIVLYASDAAAAKKAADAAFKRVDELTLILSDYEPKSEINHLSHLTDDGPMKEPFAVSPELFFVLQKSMEAARLSDGGFDVTVGPFMQLWRRSRQLGQLPTPERMEKTRASVGWQHVKLDAEHKTVQLLAPKMHLDVSGLAVGYVNDECVRVMKEAGVDRMLIDAGGDLIAGEAPPDQPGWRVAIQSLAKPGEIVGYTRVRNEAISTSGDSDRFVIIDGKRYSHIVDPRTGLGMTNRVGVTVIAPDGITCDWLDTAVPVMGVEKGAAVIEAIPGAAARITTVENESMKVYETSRFGEHKIEPSGAASRLVSQ